VAGHDVFIRSLEQTAGGRCWVFYEGPPTANGVPGTHHVEARVFKDVFPRYKTMKGYSVPRRAGWDCHGLPVELAVEKELGLAGKPDIETIGIAQFNAGAGNRCCATWGSLSSSRSGWGTGSTWPTPTRRCHRSTWTVCGGRCGASMPTGAWWKTSGWHRTARGMARPLSDHEVAQGYQTVTDPSVYVRLPLREPLTGQADVDLLVWTTTPWTLVSNTAVAVHPELTYVLARTGRGTFVVAQPLLSTVLGDRFEVLASLPGAQLAGLRYRRPFDLVEIPDVHLVVLVDTSTPPRPPGWCIRHPRSALTTFRCVGPTGFR
jgi:isoleucyl-tRNA synthetase